MSYAIAHVFIDQRLSPVLCFVLSFFFEKVKLARRLVSYYSVVVHPVRYFCVNYRRIK